MRLYRRPLERLDVAESAVFDFEVLHPEKRHELVAWAQGFMTTWAYPGFIPHQHRVDLEVAVAGCLLEGCEGSPVKEGPDAAGRLQDPLGLLHPGCVPVGRVAIISPEAQLALAGAPRADHVGRVCDDGVHAAGLDSFQEIQTVSM